MMNGELQIPIIRREDVTVEVYERAHVGRVFNQRPNGIP